MILLFLGSWRSTLIIAISNSAIHLDVRHDPQLSWRRTINIMTLGDWHSPSGFLWTTRPLRSKNIERYFEEGHAQRDAILEGASQNRGSRPGIHALHLHRVLADVPAERCGRYLFVPLAEAVVFAMLASYNLVTGRSCLRWPYTC